MPAKVGKIKAHPCRGATGTSNMLEDGESVFFHGKSLVKVPHARESALPRLVGQHTLNKGKKKIPQCWVRKDGRAATTGQG